MKDEKVTDLQVKKMLIVLMDGICAVIDQCEKYNHRESAKKLHSAGAEMLRVYRDLFNENDEMVEVLMQIRELRKEIENDVPHETKFN